MINVSKNLIKAVAEGSEQPIALKTFIMNNYSINQIVDSFVELLVSSETVNRQPISVTEDEYNAIMALFKVKGQRVMDDGTVIVETRGRKRKGE